MRSGTECGEVRSEDGKNHNNYELPKWGDSKTKDSPITYSYELCPFLGLFQQFFYLFPESPPTAG